jgi:hypothetical protein
VQASLIFSFISIDENKERIHEAWSKIREKAIGLLNKVEGLSKELEEAKIENQRLKDYIARVEGRSKKPKIKPSSSDKDSRGEICKDGDQKNTSKKGKEDVNKNKGNEEERPLVIHDTVKLTIDTIPEDWVFKGYKSFVVQDIKILQYNTNYLREWYVDKDGKYHFAELPKNVKKNGHYGEELRSFIQYTYHGLRSTEGLVEAFLNDFGFKISKSTIHNIIIKEALGLKEEYNSILKTALLSSVYIQVDDTKEIHNNKNGYFTQIANEAFTWFAANDSKNKITFLETLHAGEVRYLFTKASIEYLNEKNVLEIPELILDVIFTTKTEYQKYIDTLQIRNKATLRYLEEAALFASLINNNISPDIVIMSDDAGQFNIFKRILCWIHIERNIKKLTHVSDNFIAEVESALAKVWDIYFNLKQYKNLPNDELKNEIKVQFDALISTQVHYNELQKQLSKLSKKRSELLAALENPILPLHNNLSENNVRKAVQCREIRGSTHSNDGRSAKCIMLTIYSTCKKCFVSFWSYLLSKTSLKEEMSQLSEIVKNRIYELNIGRFVVG